MRRVRKIDAVRTCTWHIDDVAIEYCDILKILAGNCMASGSLRVIYAEAIAVKANIAGVDRETIAACVDTGCQHEASSDDAALRHAARAVIREASHVELDCSFDLPDILALGGRTYLEDVIIIRVHNRLCIVSRDTKKGYLGTRIHECEIRRIQERSIEADIQLLARDVLFAGRIESLLETHRRVGPHECGVQKRVVARLKIRCDPLHRVYKERIVEQRAITCLDDDSIAPCSKGRDIVPRECVVTRARLEQNPVIQHRSIGDDDIGCKGVVG